ncbi:MAG: leucine-rich repeat domain-containing protein, partial [Chryseobacterium taeanense]
MKKKLSLLFLLLAIMANAQIINFPDANFKAKLLSSSPANTVAKNLSGNYFAIDANGDGIIQVSEAQQVSQLNLAETSGASNISSLVGILSFTNLEILNIYYSNINSLNVQGLSNLRILNCRNNALSSINLQGCTALQKLICYTNALTVLDVHGLTNLQDLDCSGNPLTSLNVQGCSALQKLECIGSQLTVLDVHGLTNLQDLNCYSNYNGQLTSINIQGCTSLQLLDCSNNSITSLNIQGFPNLQYLNCSGNPINILNVQGLTSLQTLYCANNQLTQLNVQGLTNLQNLVCSENQLTSLDVHNLTNLEILYCNTNQMSLLNAQGCVSLYELHCNNNQLSQLNLQGVDNIYYLDCSYNQLTSLSLSSPNTTVSGGTFKLNNNLLSTVNISCPYIAVLNVNNNQLSDIPNISAYSVDELFAKNNNFNIVNISNAFLLGTINISDPISSINFSQDINNPNILERLIIETSLNSLQINGYRGDISVSSFPTLSTEIKGNNLKDIDLSNYHKIYNPKKVYNFDAPNIKTLKMKDGFTNTFGGSGANTTLSFTNPVISSSLYICADDADSTNFYNYLSSLSNLSNVNLNINSYCSFVPGGSYNTITGLVRFDENNNGCDTNDEIFEHMKLKISDGTTGETFVKNNGKYDFYTQAGNFTVTAEPENPALFTVTPATFSTSFPNNNNNIFTQDLCVTKNGNANDLEVVIAPLTNAVPGFDAKYKVMWRNKGNTILSGNVTFTFNDSKMDFVSSALPSAVS